MFLKVSKVNKQGARMHFKLLAKYAKANNSKIERESNKQNFRASSAVGYTQFLSFD